MRVIVSQPSLSACFIFFQSNAQQQDSGKTFQYTFVEVLMEEKIETH
jgi:hypothetical protein